MYISTTCAYPLFPVHPVNPSCPANGDGVRTEPRCAGGSSTHKYLDVLKCGSGRKGKEIDWITSLRSKLLLLDSGVRVWLGVGVVHGWMKRDVVGRAIIVWIGSGSGPGLHCWDCVYSYLKHDTTGPEFRCRRRSGKAWRLRT